jgi:hypothetical protein
MKKDDIIQIKKGILILAGFIALFMFIGAANATDYYTMGSTYNAFIEQTHDGFYVYPFPAWDYPFYHINISRSGTDLWDCPDMACNNHGFCTGVCYSGYWYWVHDDSLNKYVGVSGLNASTVYGLKIYGVNPYTSTAGTVYSTLSGTTAADVQRCNFNVECAGISCSIYIPTADYQACIGYAGFSHFKLKVYDSNKNLIWTSPLTYNFAFFAGQNRLSFAAPAFNAKYMLNVLRYDATETIGYNSYKIFSSGTCQSPSFNAVITSSCTKLLIDLSYSPPEYSQYGVSLYKLNNPNNPDSWAAARPTEYFTGTSYTMTGLKTATQYKAVIFGVNPCLTGAQLTKYATTLACNASIKDFSVSINNQTDTTISARVNDTSVCSASPFCDWRIDDMTGTNPVHVSTVTSNLPVIFTNLTPATAYLVTVTSHQSAGNLARTATGFTNSSYVYTLALKANAGTFSVTANAELFVNGAQPNVDVFRFINKTSCFLNGTQEQYISSYYAMAQWNNLSASTAYNVSCNVSSSSPVFNGIKNSSVVTTSAFNSSLWELRTPVNVVSWVDFKNAKRNDLDADIDAVYDGKAADNVTWKLYDTGGNSLANGSMPLVTHLIPFFEYDLNVTPVFSGQTGDEKTAHLFLHDVNTISCNGNYINAGFNYSYKLQNNFVYLSTQPNTNQSAGASSRYLVQLCDGNSSGLGVCNPIEEWNSTQWALGNYKLDSEKCAKTQLLNTTGLYDACAIQNSKEYTVYIWRTVECDLSNESISSINAFTITQGEGQAVTQYGLLQAGYDYFNAAFPTADGKFLFMLLIFVPLSIGAIFITGNGLAGAAVILVMFLLALIVNAIPGIIVGAVTTVAIIAIITLVTRVIART